MSNYFQTATTVEDIKSTYRNLAFQYHPDRGGDAEIMKEINRQYQDALKALDGRTFGEKEYRYKEDVEQELMEKIQTLLKLTSLDIALIGYWIWVTGDTRNHKERLKAEGLKWHRERKAWYYKPQGWKRSARSRGSFSELACKYGYKGFRTPEDKDLPATA
jgi:curved DNA-binding protein CbpA